MPAQTAPSQSYSRVSLSDRGVISISVVSHRQAALVTSLLSDLQACCPPSRIQVTLTVNVEESLPFRPADFAFDCTIIRNAAPKGFGANHNAASRRATGDFFCVLNPDIRLSSDPFPPLIAALRNEEVGAVTPLVVDPAGKTEDHAREFPRLASILKKAFLRATAPDAGSGICSTPDWIAGMFMLFRTETFRRIGGFDERYLLYYEDVDLCARLRAAGQDIRVESAVQVVHHARRESHRNPRHFVWHLQSMLRFLLTRPGKLPPLR